MATSYNTIVSASEGFYKEKGSKFIALAMPVTSLTEIETLLIKIRKEYHDARHHCYAYLLGSEADVFRANDDGEPNHSAGDPILGQIRSFDLTNVFVVVVRYFGGTKLGVSGLINAYKTATKEALEQATLTTKKVCKDIKLLFPYPSTNAVMKLIHELDISITSQMFDNECVIEGTLAIEHLEALINKTELLNNLGTKLKFIAL